MNRLEAIAALAVISLVASAPANQTKTSTGSNALCTCIPQPPPLEAAERADAVFLARVNSTIIVSKNEPWIRRQFRRLFQGVTQPGMNVKFEVLEVYKGVTSSTDHLITHPSSAACGYPFKEGNVYLIYGRYIDETLTTGLCTRTTLAGGSGEEVDTLRDHYGVDADWAPD